MEAADSVCEMFATNDLIASSLCCDGPIKQAESCERDRWCGLILTTEEISEIEDKGLALHWDLRNLISDPLGCPPPLSLSSSLAHLALLSTATEWLHSSLRVSLGSQATQQFLELNKNPDKIKIN